jgi:hypothetical protein
MENMACTRCAKRVANPIINACGIAHYRLGGVDSITGRSLKIVAKVPRARAETILS